MSWISLKIGAKPVSSIRGIPYHRPGMGKMDLGFDCGGAAVLLE
jgi:hypothetical protein